MICILLGGTAAHALQVRRLDPDHVEITLPPAARTATMPVVKLTFDGPISSVGSLPVSRSQPNNYRIFDANSQ